MVPQRHQDKSECSVFFVLGGGGGQRVFVDKDQKKEVLLELLSEREPPFHVAQYIRIRINCKSFL